MKQIPSYFRKNMFCFRQIWTFLEKFQVTKQNFIVLLVWKCGETNFKLF